MELAFRSLTSKNDSILEIALSNGFEDQSAFTRCFKTVFGYPPRVARQKMNIVSELECISLNEPEIIELNEFSIQAVTKQGLYYEAAPQAWNALKAKLAADELGDNFPGLFIAISHDNPHSGTVPENKVRFSAGISGVTRDLGIEKILLPGGIHARFHYQGKHANLGLAYHYIIGKWAEDSNFFIDNDKFIYRVEPEFPSSIKEQKLTINVPLKVK